MKPVTFLVLFSFIYLIWNAFIKYSNSFFWCHRNVYFNHICKSCPEKLCQSFQLKSLSFLSAGFFISNNSISRTRLKLAKNQAKAKQHFEIELFLFENYSLSSSISSSKNSKRYSKKCAKNKCVCFDEIIWLIIMKVKMKKRSHRCDINNPRPR